MSEAPMETPSNVSVPENSIAFLGAHLPTITKSAGAFLLVAPLATYLVSPALTVGDVLTHFTSVCPFIVALIYGGYWIERSGISTTRWSRIGTWFLGGLLAFLGLNVVMMSLMGSNVPHRLYPFWGFFASGVGGTAGLIIGVLEAQAIEQERLAERRRVLQEAARRRSKQFEDFAKIVSHDLRNPLNVAGGRLELAREEHDSSHLAAVDRALERMDEIIEDVLMLTWSGQEIDSEDMDRLQLGEVAQTCWSNVDAAGAELRIENSLSINANPRRLRRLLENLFRNAVEHAGTDVIVRVGALRQGFYVEDNGPGISSDKRENVFEPGISSSEEGTGLGLNIVKTIAEAHDWTVSATSGREGGARFEFVGTSDPPRTDPSLPPHRGAESAWSEMSVSSTVADGS